MIQRIIGLLLLSMVAAVADPSFEQTAEKRLHSILGTQSIQKDTRYGGRLTMIHIPDSSREKVHLEMVRLFRGLIRLGTRDAIRVLAGFLGDERYVYEPGSDYGSTTIAHKAARALEDIRDEHPNSLPGAPLPGKGPDDPSDSEAVREWSKSYDRLRIDAWRKWWTTNKASYAYTSPATPLPQ
jgi:hypothetical protein